MLILIVHKSIPAGFFMNVAIHFLRRDSGGKILPESWRQMIPPWGGVSAAFSKMPSSMKEFLLLGWDFLAAQCSPQALGDTQRSRVQQSRILGLEQLQSQLALSWKSVKHVKSLESVYAVWIWGAVVEPSSCKGPIPILNARARHPPGSWLEHCELCC